MKKYKIAIHCGEIPPPTFIDRLINGLATENQKILLVGRLTKKVSYPSKRIKIVGFSGRISKFILVFKYSILLFLFQDENKKKIDQWIKLNSKNSILLKIRYYPVLYYKPDILHVQWVKSIADWIWVKEFGIKLIVSLRGAHINYTPICEPKFAAIYKEVFPSIDGFHGVSNKIIVEATKYNANPERSLVVYSGLDLQNIIFNESKPQTDTLQIISIGRNHWKKGYRYALDAMRIVKNQNIKFTYTIVGVDIDDELYFHRKQIDLVDEVCFIPKLEFDQVMEKIRNSSLLLLPSLEEGIANVVLEAMACGTIVVSTDCGGMNEVIKNNENGFLVPIRNPDEMALAILKVTQLSENDSLNMRLLAREQIEKNHSKEKMIQDMITLYNKTYES
ncbi:glycosyltransferase family 4 protein [Flavobacterium sp.]|jgi:glycosyltransferase involved in cell wall biosynthesis|uniref:glycosyltransferase family 4 protein n=1 Tax=Flavobacterium sp. TaxID=239 RepID=UPI0037C0B14F